MWVWRVSYKSSCHTSQIRTSGLQVRMCREGVASWTPISGVLPCKTQEERLSWAGSQNAGPMLGATVVEEPLGIHAVVGPDAELVDDEHLRRQVYPHAPVQPVLGTGFPEVLHQVVGPHEVSPVPVLDGPQGQCVMGVDGQDKCPAVNGVTAQRLCPR